MRIVSGINGLDEMIDGGLPVGTINLIYGAAGSAKTLFSMQFICGGAEDGDKGIFVTLEESRENLIRASDGYGLSLSEKEDAGLVKILDMGAIRVSSGAGIESEGDMISFEALLEAALKAREEDGVSRMVVDSLSAIALYYPTVDEYRRELFRFCRRLKASGMTVVLIGEATKEGHTKTDVEQFIADSMILLGYENVEGEYRRTMTVYKMRFTRHDPYKHPFLITPSGIEVDSQESIF